MQPPALSSGSTAIYRGILCLATIGMSSKWRNRPYAAALCSPALSWLDLFIYPDDQTPKNSHELISFSERPTNTMIYVF